MTEPNTQNADFGFERVSPEEKTRKVADVFHSVAAKYDLMNDLMSLGVHRLWKRYAVEHSSIKTGSVVLDLAGGTGDMAARFAERVGASGMVVLSDINSSMLRLGRDRMIDSGHVGNIAYAQINAEALPFVSNKFDCVCIAFGLRNVTDKARALREMQRVLKPGGCILVLEFSKPQSPGFTKLYDFYSFEILPRLGKFIVNDEKSYRYLAESIRMHPDQEALKTLMQDSGLERCDYTNLAGGVVALHRGFKL